MSCVDISRAFEHEPPAQDFIFSGLLAGTVGAFVAPGGAGKSTFALQAAMSLACGVLGGDLLKLRPSTTGRVLYLAAEDHELQLITRIHRIGKHLPTEARHSISRNLRIETAFGKHLDILHGEFREKLIASATGARLVILDTLSRFHTMDENSNRDMCRMLAILEIIASQTGASILFVHHTHKYADQGQQHAARGASALIDNSRWCGYVQRMTLEESKKFYNPRDSLDPIGHERRESYLKFGTSKSNYRPSSVPSWYFQSEDGVLLPVEIKAVKKNYRPRLKAHAEDIDSERW